MKLSEKAKSVLNNEHHIEKREGWMKRLDNLFDGKPDPYLDEYVFTVEGIAGKSEIDLYKNPEEWIIDCLEDLARRIGETEKEFTFVPACIMYGLYGVHFIDKILGANVFYKEKQWWSDDIGIKVGSLQAPDLDSNEVFSLAKRACRAFIDQNVRLPFYGLPTIASALNIIINLYSEEILVAMLTDGDAVKHDLRIIQDVLLALHKWFQNELPAENLQLVVPTQRTQPRNYGQICGCSMALISSECYREFIEPLDAELLGVYKNGGMIHLCGSHLQHINSLRDMKELRSIQVNDRAAHDLKAYFNELRKDQIFYLNPCKGMPVEKALEITGGNRLVICGDQGELRKPGNR